MIQNIWSKIRGLNDDGFLDTMAMLGGRLIWVDGANGDDVNRAYKDEPIKTMKQALALATAGANDVVVIKNSGSTATLSTVRMDAALDWNKACTHIVAQSPVEGMFSPRARIAPTASTTAFASFFTLSASGCLVKGIQFWHGFTTGVASAIDLAVSGAYNRFYRCQIAGMADAASAASTGSRCLKLTGGENMFEECVIGVDTVSRGVANANIEFASGAPRNLFKKCVIPMWSTNNAVLGIIVAAAAGSDRFQLFRSCSFINFGTATVALATLAANMGGAILLEDCKRYNIADWGTDATSLAQMYISDGGTPNGHTGGAFVVTASS